MSHSVPGMRTAGSAWTAFTRSRRATTAILLNFLCISASAGNIGSNTEVKASGFQLFVDGKLFAIKGMNYSPVPIGKMPGGNPPTGGPPYGDYFVPNYANVWKPDIDKIREAGVNVIKLYAGDPKLNAGGAGTAGNWKAFLDYCWNNGNKPVYVIMFSYTKGEVIAGIFPGFDGYLTDYTLLVSSTANHPAVFGYMIGNEIFGGTLTQNPTFWANFGKLIDAANAAGLPYGKKPFLTTATDDKVGWPAIRLGELSGKLKNIDAWSINIYRGSTVGVPIDSPFTQYAQLMRELAIKKPLIFGEWGTPHTTRNKDDYGKNPAPLVPIRNLDDVPESEMGPGKPYFDARPVRNTSTKNGIQLKPIWRRKLSKSVSADSFLNGPMNIGKPTTSAIRLVGRFLISCGAASPAAMRMRPGSGSPATWMHPPTG